MKVDASIDVGDHLNNLIIQLAHQIGVAADKIFPWYVKQQLIEGCSNLGLGLALLVTGCVMVIVGLKKADWKDGNGYIGVAGLGGIFLLMVLLGAATSLDTNLGRVFNPQYAATHQILIDISRLK